MNTAEILTALDAEIAILQQARALLSGSHEHPIEIVKPKAGRPAGSTGKKKRKLTPEGRARIAAAVKARWVRQKKAAK